MALSHAAPWHDRCVQLRIKTNSLICIVGTDILIMLADQHHYSTVSRSYTQTQMVREHTEHNVPRSRKTDHHPQRNHKIWHIGWRLFVFASFVKVGLRNIRYPSSYLSTPISRSLFNFLCVK